MSASILAFAKSACGSFVEEDRSLFEGILVILITNITTSITIMIKWIGVLQDTARVLQSLTNQYQGTNETPLLCWKHWPVRLQLVAKDENVQFWPQNLDI